ncbi:hypothetical protein ACRALDRAFT_2102851, partial [Sodiomyces alcalophilus JCM 7366]|uniref:uncharacterized protein n=1 Tax=Sodiomyces alcalophilus JCM 7366 TaxID=591952 RepID=UPI0039B4D1D9
NYGIRITSRIESSHAKLKSYLRNRLADLYLLLTVIYRIVKNKAVKLELEVGLLVRLTLPTYRSYNTVKPLISRVSYKALNLL